MQKQHPIAQAILAWYDVHKRSLPWRDVVTPYRSWISEVMLQQTRVTTVKPYFARFMATFPTVDALANGVEKDVLALWAGLGYYSRARSLHKAAKLIVAQGGFPKTRKEIQKLPGIGPYISGAIASIAFGLDCPAVDGNHHRVLSRLFQHSGDRKAMWSLAEKVLPKGRAGDFNQALMDLGSGVCTAKNPKCEQCPISHLCKAYLAKEVSKFPVKAAKKKVPTRVLVCGQLVKDSKTLVAKRPSSGLYGGLFEMPSFFIDPQQEVKQALCAKWKEEFQVDIRIGHAKGSVSHVLTHMKIDARVFEVLGETPQRCQFYKSMDWVSSAAQVPMSTLSSKVFSTATEHQQLPLFAAESKED